MTKSERLVRLGMIVDSPMSLRDMLSKDAGTQVFMKRTSQKVHRQRLQRRKAGLYWQIFYYESVMYFKRVHLSQPLRIK
jgi:hypothetical protein